MRTRGASSLLLRAAVTASAVAIAFVAFGSAAASASTARATINTFKKWDGSQFVWQFGCPNTTTYGQVITVPAGLTHLNKFTFTWANAAGSGSMVVRADVYAWDGSKATGSSLFEKKRAISFGDSIFHLETFKPNGITVTPLAQYVLFASIDKDFEKCTNDYILKWGAVDDSVYSGGTFVYQNNGGDESQWTATPWNTFGIDLAFKAFLT
jgi:hypothetical protein